MKMKYFALLMLSCFIAALGINNLRQVSGAQNKPNSPEAREELYRVDPADPRQRSRPDSGDEAGGNFARDAVESDSRGGGVPRGYSAGPHHQRARGRGPARRGVLERGHRHVDLCERVPADPPRDEEGHPQPDAAHKKLGGERGVDETHARHGREAGRRLLHLRNRQEPGGLRGAARLPGATEGRDGLPLRQPVARKPGHRAQTDSIRREQGARVGAIRIDRLLYFLYTALPGVGMLLRYI